MKTPKRIWYFIVLWCMALGLILGGYEAQWWTETATAYMLVGWIVMLLYFRIFFCIGWERREQSDGE